MNADAARRIVQLTLGVLLLCSASVISVGLGHGGFFLGQIVVFSPVAAILVIAVVAVILAAGWWAPIGRFTAVVTIFTGLLLVPAAIMILLDGPILVVSLSTVPLFGVWLIALLRWMVHLVWGRIGGAPAEAPARRAAERTGRTAE